MCFSKSTFNQEDALCWSYGLITKALSFNEVYCVLLL
ncbi:hypothetical protein KUCAC02_003849 [Chaenocephalus aceratus]|uniref:Uncharacterized protein n=1 Tax=Chaenocephalus aceratus TaxID=36190 RepID=A0ACB9WNH5_CHAAC|nr:hypothetical protein KUCAC02_003849 [Chaenocephalus aceratus]